MIGKYIEIIDNILNVQDDNGILIPHVCNNLGIMGAGVAKVLRDKWPYIFPAYCSLCIKKGKKDVLGDTVLVYLDKDIIVANMIAQDGLPSQSNPTPLNYDFLEKCMKRIHKEIVHQVLMGNKYNIHCPKFGCGRAGGNFEFILELIREQWLEKGIDVTVYNFEE